MWTVTYLNYSYCFGANMSYEETHLQYVTQFVHIGQISYENSSVKFGIRILV